MVKRHRADAFRVRASQPRARTDAQVSAVEMLPDAPRLPRAACRGEDPELWFSDIPEETAEAREVCQGCPERVPCLDWALRTDQRYGVWGGMGPGERRPLARERRRAVA